MIHLESQPWAGGDRFISGLSVQPDHLTFLVSLRSIRDPAFEGQHLRLFFDLHVHTHTHTGRQAGRLADREEKVSTCGGSF